MVNILHGGSAPRPPAAARARPFIKGKLPQCPRGVLSFQPNMDTNQEVAEFYWTLLRDCGHDVESKESFVESWVIPARGSAPAPAAAAEAASGEAPFS